MFNGNIISTEIGLNRRSLLTWILIIAAVIIIYLGSFAWMEDMDLVEMIEGYPDIFTTGLGMSPAMFGDVNLYHGGLVLLYVLLLASIYAMMLAGGMVTRDIELGTVEFLYTRPLSRTVILLSKVLAFIIMITLFWIVAYLISAAIGVLWVAPDSFDLYNQFLAHLMGYLACLAAGGIAFAFAPLLSRVQGTTSLAVAFGFGFFLLNSLAAMFEQLEFLKFFSIHYYADLSGASGGEASMAGIVILAAVFVAGVAIGIALLDRREFAG